jgi:hypothetical protein
MADVHLHDDVLIVGASLVIGDPAALRNLKLTILNQLFNFILFGLAQSRVPHVEVFHLYVCKSTIFVHW